jgi:undecaprenyl-diphosphatase
MFDFLNELDKVTFLLINKLLANSVTDSLMPFFTNDTFLRVVFVLIIVSLLIFGNKRNRWLVLFVGLTLLLTDQASAALIKPLIARARPCHLFSADEINLLVGCGSGYSMPSAHAANTFGQAALLSMYVRYTRWPLYLFATIVALSRVFVGVHYPGDIIVGGMVGYLIGKIVGKLFGLFDRKVLVPSAMLVKVEETAKPPADPTPEGTDASQS